MSKFDEIIKECRKGEEISLTIKYNFQNSVFETDKGEFLFSLQDYINSKIDIEEEIKKALQEERERITIEFENKFNELC
jgi:hypothetical protein